MRRLHGKFSGCPNCEKGDRPCHPLVPRSARWGSEPSSSATPGGTCPQIDGGQIFVAITRLLSTSLARVLVDALTLLLIGGEELANPGPELATATGTTAAEDHLVYPGAGVNFHLAERTTLTLTVGFRHRDRNKVDAS